MSESKKESLSDFLKRISQGDEEALKEWDEIILRISETKTYEDNEYPT